MMKLCGGYTIFFLLFMVASRIEAKCAVKPNNGHVDWPSKTTAIPNKGFYNCKELTSISIPSTVRSIGSNVFLGSNLKVLYIDSPTVIRSTVRRSCFFRCSYRYTSFWEAKLSSISLDHLIFGENIQELSAYVFAGASTKIRQITFSKSLQKCANSFGGTQPQKVRINGEAIQSCIPSSKQKIETLTIGGDTVPYIYAKPNSCQWPSLTSLVTEETVSSVAYYAFSRCAKLSDVRLSSSLESIGNYAFYRSGLASISIPDSVTTIGTGTFQMCTKLSDVRLSSSLESIGNNAFLSTNVVAFRNWPGTLKSTSAMGIDYTKVASLTVGGATVDDNAFVAWTSVVSLVISEPITKIGTGSFNQLKLLNNVTLPKSLNEIGARAFEGCSSLSQITLPDSVISLKSNAFSETGLVSISIPDSVTTIGIGTFQMCTKLSDVRLSSSLESIGNYAFYRSGLASISIPDSVTTIGTGTFQMCTKLSDVRLSSSLESIGNNAFLSTNVVAFRNWPGTLKSTSAMGIDYTKVASLTVGGATVDDNAFVAWTSVVSLVISEPITKIGTGSFNQLKLLNNVTLPKSLNEIGARAFEGCSSLSQITLPDSVISLKSNAFSETGLVSVSLPPSVVFVDSGVFSGCSQLVSIEIPESVTSIGPGVFARCSSLTRVDIPDSVTNLRKNLFLNCTNLRDVSIPDTVNNIHPDAFKGCSLLMSCSVQDNIDENGHYVTPEDWTRIEAFTFFGCSSLVSIIIKESVKSIQYGAFFSCVNLRSVGIPDSVEDVSSRAFNGCTELEKCHVENDIDQDGHYTVPSNWTSLEAFEFYGCRGLKSIAVPNTITEIQYWAFRGCENLVSISIPHTVTAINSAAFEGCSGLLSCSIIDEIQDGEYTFDNSTTTISAFMFYGCSTLETLKITESIQSVQYQAFRSCINLNWLVVPASLSNIAEGAFQGVPITILEVASNTLVSQDFEQSSFVERYIPDSHLKILTISSNVTRVGANSFSGCTDLHSVSLPESLTSIGPRAFAGCKKILFEDIPSSVTSLGAGAFFGCSSLEQIHQDLIFI